MNVSSKAINIYFVEMGEFISTSIDLDKLSRTLNKLQTSFLFEKYNEKDDELKNVSKFQFNNNVCCDSKLVFQALVGSKQPYLSSNNTLIIGITSAWIADSTGNSVDPINISDCYFGYWHNQLVDTGSNDDRRFAVISIAPWLLKYENLSLRDIYQYLSFMVVAFIGDYIHPDGMTHPEFRWCVYDYNPDMDSICQSIRKSRICDQCQTKIGQASLSKELHPKEINSSLEKLLKYSRRPKFLDILRAYIDHPVFAFFGAGLILSIFSNLITYKIEHFGDVVMIFMGICIAWFVALIVKEHFWPGKKLG